jgi:hypothetical protein
MRSKINIIPVVLFIIFLSNMLIASEQQNKQDDSGSQYIKKLYPDSTPMTANVDEAIQDENDISSAVATGDLKALQNLADKLEAKWFDKDKKYYWYIMSLICREFYSSVFNDEGEYELASKYAIQTLDKMKNLPESDKATPNIEFSLLMKIHSPSLTKANILQLSETGLWNNKRSEIVKLYFQSWERLEKKIDPNYGKFDPNYRPAPIRPPPGVNFFFSGMSPAAIKDPNLRAQYEKTLQEDHEKKMRGREQFQLMRTKKESLPLIQSDILFLYSGPLYESKTLDIDALNADIFKYVKDEKTRQIILEAMKNKLTEELKPKTKIQMMGTPLTSIKTGSIYKDFKSEANNPK